MASSASTISQKRDASHFEIDIQEAQNKRLKPFSDIYPEIVPKSPEISLDALEKIYHFILANGALFQQASQSGKSIYIRREASGLERTIQFSPENRVYIHFNRISISDEPLGSGVEKIAVFAIELLSGEWHASTSLNMPMGEDEREALAFFKGIPGFVQMTDEAFYDFSEKQLARFENPPTTQKQRILFKLCNGGDLETWLSQLAPVLSLPRFLQNKKSIFESLIEHVSFMHQNNWMHRDLKMKNLFLQTNHAGLYEVVIGDFGAACKMDQLDKRRNVTATPDIVAPELAILARDVERSYFVKAAQEEEANELSMSNEAELEPLVPNQEELGPLEQDDEIESVSDETVTPYSSPSADIEFDSDEEPISFDPNIDATIERLKSEIGNATTPTLDVWAMGCVLYKLLEGKNLPWAGETELDEIYTSIGVFSKSEEMNRWFPEPENTNSPLHLVWEMLRPDPLLRITTVAALQRLVTLDWL